MGESERSAGRSGMWRADQYPARFAFIPERLTWLVTQPFASRTLDQVLTGKEDPHYAVCRTESLQRSLTTPYQNSNSYQRSGDENDRTAGYCNCSTVYCITGFQKVGKCLDHMLHLSCIVASQESRIAGSCREILTALR